MVLSLAVTHTPDEAQLYVVDFGGGTLVALAGLPHVGTVASRLEPDLVRRVSPTSRSLLAEREALFRRARHRLGRHVPEVRAEVASPPPTCPTAGRRPVPVIDGWAAFRERFEPLEP